MTAEIERSVEVLERTPGVLQALLGGSSDFWSRSNYGPDTFSPFDVVGHLIHAERTNWMTRLRVILEHGEAHPLPAFDRYAMYEASKGKSVAALLDTHPQLGSVTIGNLIAAWAVHDLGHTHQVVKAMAYQYRDEVGPWRELLTILPRR